MVVPLDAVDPIRNYAMPPNNYYNPRSEQCIGTSLTLDEGHLKWLGRYFENNREIHGNLIGMLDRDFEVFSDRTTNLTPTMCLLKPRHDKALDKLTKVAGIKFEIRSMFDGLIAIPTDSWYVVDTLSPVYT
ncbi:MAG: hypothetical protein DRJ03_04680 [Chloroflexi bacterium]|nr:MAG: hypothetical protein DRJ03_04680 [Chloroflexota bacterium]